MSTVQEKRNLVQVQRATVRFAGDSGDGMQLVGDPVCRPVVAGRQRHLHSAGLSFRDPGLRPDRWPASAGSS